MNRATALLAVCCFVLLSSLAHVATVTSETEPMDDKLVYADFEMVEDNKPLSNRGGVVKLFAYSENASNPSRFKGGAAPDIPEVVRLSKDDPNRAITFGYQFLSPNQWAGVGVEVQGQAEKDGTPVADDVSEYKYMSVQIYVTGVQTMSAEFLSQGQGIKMNGGYPQMSFRVKEGFNTYRLKLSSINQPTWAEIKVNPKDLLKKLTAIHLVASCAQCAPTNGVIVVDNIVFEK